MGTGLIRLTGPSGLIGNETFPSNISKISNISNNSNSNIIMTTTPTIALYQLGVRNLKTYLFALLFIAGNILLPQLCHLVPQGGLILLPIYFFTLVGAYKYGFTVGLFTAVLSPLLNNVLFAMPAAPMLPVIMVKGTLLAAIAAFVASRAAALASDGAATTSGEASNASRANIIMLVSLVIAVVAAQLFGSLFEWAYTGSLSAALQDIALGWPGLLLQVFGGYLVLSFVLKK